MKTVKRFSALLLAILLIASLSSVAFALDNYTPVNGPDAVPFITKLDVGADASVPDVEFEYTIAVGAAGATGTTIFAGVDGVVFKNNDNKATFTHSMTKDNSNCVSVTDYLDFSACEFKEPGVYHYVLTATAKSGFTMDTDSVRHIYLTVKDKQGANEGELDPDDNNEVKVKLDVDTPKNTFTNTYGSQRLTFKKTVTGEQGSRDKRFKFTLNVTNAGNGTVLTVDMSGVKPIAATNIATTHSLTDMQTANNVATLTCNAQGAVSHDFYLSHDDTVVIKGLPAGAHYVIDEEDRNTDGYTTSIPTNATGNIGTASVTVEIINNRPGTIPTGVMLSVVPGVLIVAAAAAGLILLGRKKKTEA